MAIKIHSDADSPNTSASPMTLDEYYAMRAAEEQDQYYLQGSRNRKESHNTYIAKPYTKEDEAADKRFMNHYAKVLADKAYMSDAEFRDRVNNATLLGAEQTAQAGVDFLSRDLNRRIEILRNRQAFVDFVANCIATATSNNPNKGHYVMGNQTFAANPRKYGFKKVSKEEAKPGSLVQVVGRGVPYHAMILNSRNENGERYNYSPGNYPKYKVNAGYPLGDFEDLNYYNFVGNEADSARWKNEYEQKYKQKSGGRISSKPITNNAILTNDIMDRLFSNFKGYSTLKKTLVPKQNTNFNKQFKKKYQSGGKIDKGFIRFANFIANIFIKDWEKNLK